MKSFIKRHRRSFKKNSVNRNLFIRKQSNEDYFEGLNDYFDGTMGI